LPEREAFGRLYSSDSWQRLFSADHGILMGRGLPRRSLVPHRFRRGTSGGWAGSCVRSHSSDARPQTWPLIDRVFASPVSSWERDRATGVVGGVEAVAVLAPTL